MVDSCQSSWWQPEPVTTSPATIYLHLIGCLAVLLVFVMTSRRCTKAAPHSSPHPMQHRAKKIRSISVSADLEASNSATARPHTRSAVQQYLRICEERNRTISATESIENYLRRESLHFSHMSMGKTLSTLRKIGEKDHFPFARLPDACKLKIFSFLTPCERGAAAQVCSEWSRLMKASTLWRTVDFTVFPLCTDKSPRHSCSELCYSDYKTRVKKFMKYLVNVKPALHVLRFAFDIGDCKDGWMECIQSLVKSSRCIELEAANLNWKETAAKPFWSESFTWSTSDYNDLVYRQRRRQRMFVSFFDHFTVNVPYLKQLVIPFDWSPRSIKALGRLEYLETLVLEKYFLFQTLEQNSVDQVFAAGVNLQRVILETWTPSGRDFMSYHVKNESLQHLDISQCRGFYLQSVHLPSLQVIKLSRNAWSGCMVVSNSALPCVYEVLSEGAPNIRQVNEHVLHADWREDTYEELEVVLKAVCSCSKHKTSWGV